MGFQEAKSGQNSNPSRSKPKVIPGAHNGIYCNVCKQSPIQGVRFKCTVRPNYDLCATCEAKDPEQHPMIKIRVPERKDIHHNVACDMCNVSPIIGVRFKCTVRPNFDLCETCEAKDPEQHPMIKMRVASRFSASHGNSGRWRGHGRGHGGRWRGGRGFCGRRGRGRGRGGQKEAGKWKQWKRGHFRGNWRRFMRMMSQPVSVDADQKISELPTAPLSFGACGPHVAYLQRVLIQLGYMDQSAIRWRAGFYGPRTTQAVSQVASAMHLESAEERSGVFTNAIREHLVKQLDQEVTAPEQPMEHQASRTKPATVDAVAPEPVSEPEPVPELVSDPVPEPVVSDPVDIDDVDFVVVSEPVSEAPSEPESEPVHVSADAAPVERELPQDLVNASPYAVQLDVLRAMGFNDRDRAAMLEVLSRTGGNLEATIDWLLNH